MPRRVNLPGAAELFRATKPAATQPASTRTAPSPSSSGQPAQAAVSAQAGAGRPETEPRPTGAPKAIPDQGGSGRVRHDEKITVYVSTPELIALEEARLMLRSRHGMAVDRGRIVREAIAALLADLASHGDDSELVRRLSST